MVEQDGIEHTGRFPQLLRCDTVFVEKTVPGPVVRDQQRRCQSSAIERICVHSVFVYNYLQTRRVRAPSACNVATARTNKEYEDGLLSKNSHVVVQLMGSRILHDSTASCAYFSVSWGLAWDRGWTHRICMEPAPALLLAERVP